MRQSGFGPETIDPSGDTCTVNNREWKVGSMEVETPALPRHVCLPRTLVPHHLIVCRAGGVLTRPGLKRRQPGKIHCRGSHRLERGLLCYLPGTFRTNGFALSRPPTMVACFILLMSDLPCLFLKLRWGFIEAAAQWVLWVYHEAARRYELRAGSSPRMYSANTKSMGPIRRTMTCPKS